MSVTAAGHASGRIPALSGSDAGSRRLSLSEIDAGQLARRRLRGCIKRGRRAATDR